ncbi:MAG: hypothetical protein N2490_01860 [Ignavibacteria bacterium]|nr:hypothetical protein [Ignavibacteria bacterium]
MKPALIINIVTSVVVTVVGILIIFGVAAPGLSLNLRITFGVVFAAYGVYRFLNFLSKIKMQKYKEDHERIEEAKDELLKKKIKK